MTNIMQVQTISDSHLRRAVATTLKQWFERDVILEALCVIEDLFKSAKDSGFGVIVLVNGLSDHFGWSKQMKHDARLLLYKNMLPNATLDPDPEAELAEFRKNREPFVKVAKPTKTPQQRIVQKAAKNDDTTAQRPELVVFCQLIYSLRKTLHRNYPAQFEIFEAVVTEEISELNVGIEITNWINRLITQKVGTSINVDLSTDEMAAIVHTFYNAISEAVGPIDADKILTAAILQTEKIPAALQFSPKSFL